MAWTRAWIAVVVLGTACGDNPRGGPDAGPVDRGRYIMNVLGACSFCHTPILPDGTRDQTRAFAGIDCLADTDPSPGMGCISSRNLTPHATGLLGKTDTEIKDAFLNGVRTDGKSIIPIMPYYIFHNMAPTDADAIVAYMRSLPAVNHQVQANQPPWDNGWPAGQVEFVASDSIPRVQLSYPGDQLSANRGRYIAGTLGLCIDCHTVDYPFTDPRALTQVIQRDKFLQGGRLFLAPQLGYPSPPYPFMIYTSNITPDLTTGIGMYKVADIVNLFRTGKDIKGDFVCAPTHGGPTAPYAGLTDQDASDLANYVLSVTPVSHMVDNSCKGIQ